VFQGPRGDGTPGSQLWMKRRESGSSTPIAGTIDALSFTLSPDGTTIAFALGSKLLKVPVAGGVPVTLVNANVNGDFGVAWLEDGTIVYSHPGALLSLAQVSADGGVTTEAWKSDSDRAVVLAPIAGTHGVLFYRCTNGSRVSCDLWALDLKNKRSNLVLHNVQWARYAETGHLVYAQDGRLMAVGFDARTFGVRGEPVALADSVSRGDLPFELSRSGTLVTRGDDGAGVGAFEMVWVDRAGRATPVDTGWRFDVSRYAADQGWALSPDGSRVAIGLYTDAGDDIWVKQLPTGPLSRVSFDPAPEVRPHWMPGGHAVSFISARAALGVYQRRADGLGSDSLLGTGLVDEAVVSPDGAWLVLRAGSNGSVRGGRDITGIRLGGDTTRVPLIVTPFDEEAIALSPDGKWIAYQSDETGRTEVFVRSFPNTGAFKHQVSNGGGVAPLWSRDGRELFFLGAGNDMMTSRVTAGAPISLAAPVSLFHVTDDLLKVEFSFYTPWDVAADGRFLMARARRAAGANGTTVLVAENWLTELKARVKR
jgi:hypothetical protein